MKTNISELYTNENILVAGDGSATNKMILLKIECHTFQYYDKITLA